MSKYLDENGLLYFWQKLKAYFAAKTEIPEATSTSPKMDGTAAVGSESKWAKGDHVHPTDTSRAPLASPTFTGTPEAPTAAAGTNTTQIATTAFVKTAVDAKTNVDTADALSTAHTIDGVSFDGTSDITHYAVCETAAATVDKEVVCAGFNLEEGALIAVKFNTTNTGAVAKLTLNVNGTGAKAIKYRNANLPSAGTLAANRIYAFVYDGSQYELIGDLDTNTTYSNATLGQGYGVCGSESSVEAKVVTLSNYVLAVGGIVSIKFNYAVNLTTNTTLNINGKGAKPLYYKGTRAAITNLILGSEIATFIYDGTAYHLIGRDVTQDASTNYHGYMTPTMVTKLNGIETGAEVNVVETVKVNGTALTVTDKAVDVSVPVASSTSPKMDGTAAVGSESKWAKGDHVHPTDTSRAPLASPTFTGTPEAPTAAAGTNTTQIATTAFVKTAVDNAIAGVTQISYEVVTSLPTTGQAGVIYLVPHSHGTSDAYDEYIWVASTSSFEKIGNTDVDLSGYWAKADLVAITNAEIDTIVAS